MFSHITFSRTLDNVRENVRKWKTSVMIRKKKTWCLWNSYGVQKHVLRSRSRSRRRRGNDMEIDTKQTTPLRVVHFIITIIEYISNRRAQVISVESRFVVVIFGNSALRSDVLKIPIPTWLLVNLLENVWTTSTVVRYVSNLSAAAAEVTLPRSLRFRNDFITCCRRVPKRFVCLFSFFKKL